MAENSKEKIACFNCGNKYIEANYYKSNSIFYSNNGKIPYCKQCLKKFYQDLVHKYTNEGYSNPERKAVKRLCMVLDIYYRDDVYDSALRKAESAEMDVLPFTAYMNIIQLSQYNRKKQTYENTISDEEEKQKESFLTSTLGEISNSANIDPKVKDFWGHGFDSEDYKFLQREYEDWVTRHECQTKAQEEVFKRICFKQLEILKATRAGEDTKNLDDTFQKLLDTAKLQPKQNSNEAVSDAQTFGTLIDRWENTRPLPEIDEELKDVDKVGLYLDTFFRGHLAKMMGLKNGYSHLYDDYMKRYTVEKPEYESDEGTEALFDAIFGNAMDDDEEVV